MKLSLCNEVIHEMPFEAQCDFAAKLGYDALEIAPFTIIDDPRQLSSGDLTSVRRALSDAGIVCSSLHWLLVSPDGLSLTSEDPGIHDRTIDVMRRLVDLAAELGADVLVHGSPKQRQLTKGREAQGRDQALACFRAAADASEKAGVIYCAEPLASEETNFINTVDEAAAIVSEIGSSAFRTMVDCAATLRMNQDPATLLDQHLDGDLIAHVQVNDGNRRGPGEGEHQFTSVLATLKRHKYAGWIGVEPFVYVPDGKACAARSIGYLHGIMEGLK